MRMVIVDMSSERVEWSEVAPEYEQLGGRALTSRMINEQVSPTCDPLGPDNVLIIAPGLLTGTTLPNTSRLSIGAKSPLTGGIKESNVGGTIGDAIARLQIKAIVVRGKPKPDKKYILHIAGGDQIELLTASQYVGMKTYSLTGALKERFGRFSTILSIGPAGEMEMKCASVQSTDTEGRPCRAAGRGGLGAVLGSKGLKAIVISASKAKPISVCNSSLFKKVRMEFSRSILAAPFSGRTLPAFGTAALVGLVNSLGAFPCFNARKGYYETWEKISGEKMAEMIKRRGGVLKHAGCSGCIIRCSNVFVDERGDYITSGLEYETIWALGGMCAIDSLDTIAKFDFMCDDIGLDTMNVGAGIGVAMDAGFVPFGDAEKALKLVQEVEVGTDLGRLIGDGPVSVGEHFGHHRVPVCKNQSIAGYDPRALQGMAVTYATSPMGADHTAGNLIGESLSGVVKPLEKGGQIEVSRKKQITIAGIDSLGLCLFTAAAATDDILVSLISARLGVRMAVAEMRQIWRSTLDGEREFNRRAGLGAESDRLPTFFFEEPLPPHNQTVLFNDAEIDSTFR